MRRVEQRERLVCAVRTVRAGLGRRVMAQVRGEERVDTGGADVVEEAVAGPATDRDGPYGRVRVARHPDALRGRGQPFGGARGEFTDGERVVEFADPAQATTPVGVAGIGHEGPYDAQVEGAA